MARKARSRSSSSVESSRERSASDEEPVPASREVRINDAHPEFPDNTLRHNKYTLLSFIPKVLWEQFKRWVNRYFLLIALLQLNPTLTPVNPATTWAPLGIVLAVSMLKEYLDDAKVSS